MKTPAGLSQDNLEILQFVYILVLSQVSTLISLLFQGILGVKPAKNTQHFLPLETPNLKDISSYGSLLRV
ncbi:hypothetical protein MXB_4976 [Myxobolus squamalis]|nr:hypothetical protein MXB_4976 [Myxobolus squamalis]